MGGTHTFHRRETAPAITLSRAISNSCLTFIVSRFPSLSLYLPSSFGQRTNIFLRRSPNTKLLMHIPCECMKMFFLMPSLLQIAIIILNHSLIVLGSFSSEVIYIQYLGENDTR